MMHIAQPRIRRMNFSISESMINLIKQIINLSPMQRKKSDHEMEPCHLGTRVGGRRLERQRI
jgi:hypothetical protein